jgi:hypothetical protein
MQRKRRWKIFAILSCAAIVLVLALPSIMGSRWLYQPLVDRLAAERFNLQIGNVDLSWFRPLAFHSIELQPISNSEDSAGEILQTENALQDAVKDLVEEDRSNLKSVGPAAPLLSIRTVRCNRSLLGFLLGGRDLGEVHVVDANIDIKLLEDDSNLESLIRAVLNSRKAVRDPQVKQNSKPNFDVAVTIDGIQVTVADGRDQQVLVVPPFDATVSYLGRNDPPQVVVEPTSILDEAQITPELAALGLVRAVPLLARSSRFDGHVSLQTERVVIPLDRIADTTGAAQLTLHQVRSVPTDPTILAAIDLMGRLFNRELSYELIFVDGSQINCEMRDRRVMHQGVRAGLPQVDERLQMASSGWVSLDTRQLALDLEIPLPVEQIARRQTVKQLGVPSITLPIRGTLDQLELDWQTLRLDSADVLAEIAGALSEEAPLLGGVISALSDVTEGNSDEAIQASLELAKDLWQKRQDRLKDERDANDDDPQKSQAPKKPLRETLKNLLRGNEK